MGSKRHRGRMVLLLLASLGIGAATAAVVRRRLAGPTPFPPGPPVPTSRPTPPPPPSPPPPPPPPVAPEITPEISPGVPPGAGHAPDVVSDPEMNPLDEGSPLLDTDD